MTEMSLRLAERLSARFGAKLAHVSEPIGQTTIEVAVEHLREVAQALRDEAHFRFEILIDLCGVDYLGFGRDEWDTVAVTHEGYSRGVEANDTGRLAGGAALEPSFAGRFASVVHLLSISRNERLRVRSFAPDVALPVVPSLVEVWPAANWFEREAFDLYGIVFEGHPDLRRLLTDYGFVGYPFRKDFPLIGNVEVRYDAAKGRVVYEPVSIEPRVLVPRVVRDDSRYLQDHEQAASQDK